MRAALILVLVVGCAKKTAEAPAKSGDTATATNAATAPAPTESPKSPPPAETGAAPGGGDSVGAAGSGSAVDQARASGVLGPTDQHAFAIKSSVAIKTASTKALDAAAKTHLDAVKACYDKALEFQDTLSGELTLTIKDGTPTVAKSTLKHAELEKCVVEALTALPKARKATLVLAFKRE